MNIADMAHLIIEPRTDHRGGFIVTLDGQQLFSSDLKASCIDFVSGWRNAERHFYKSQ
jgi:hypothetical protein